MCNFTHLHGHSDASKDGLGTVSNLVSYAKFQGFDALALTDHATHTNAIQFSKKCKDAGIKPILGYEGYVEFGGQIGHITLLADGNRGYSNLIELGNLAHASTYKYPAFTIEQMLKHSEDVICLSGCMASPIHRLPESEAISLISKLRSVYEDRFFIEVMIVNDDRVLWEKMLKFSQDLKIAPVLTNDFHFPKRDDARIHNALTSIRAGFDYTSKNLWLMTRKDLEHRIKDLGLSVGLFTEALDNAYLLGQKINTVNLASVPKLPHWPNADNEVRSICESQFTYKTPATKEYRDRLEKEIKVIIDAGFSTYFLITKDLIDYAKKNGVRVGAGRGSGAGSLVLFLMGITEIDPIKYNLSFERFLNPERLGFPDVDTDFDDAGRDLVIEYAKTKWGAYPVGTLSKWQHKSLIHDLCRYYAINNKEIEDTVADMSNKINSGEDGDEEVDNSNYFKESDEYKELISIQPDIDYAYDAMINQIRHRGKHAGGVVITDIKVPLERVKDGLLASAWSESSNGLSDLSSAGIVKFDLLGITALNIIKRLEQKIGKKAEEPFDDSPVFDLFKTGNTTGIFQFAGSTGIIEFTKAIQPRRIQDLIVINALYRPGPMDSSTAKMYPEWSINPRKIHPLVDDLLEDTFGGIVYQEDFINLYARANKCSFGQADIARRIIVKAKKNDLNWQKEFFGVRDNFVNGFVSQGMDSQIAKNLWDEVATHTRYSFNKSHSTCYSLIAYEMAWWKYHHPVAYYCELLNADSEKAATYTMAAALDDIRVVPPHVNYSSFEYEFDEDTRTIYMPLQSVKFLGENAAKAIISQRDLQGQYTSLIDFVERFQARVVNARSRESLYALGAFNGIDGQESDLKLKNPVDVTKWQENQKQYLGYLIPNKEIMNFIEKNTLPHKNQYAGLVVWTKDKVSNYDQKPFTSYSLLPSQGCWSKEDEHRVYEIGDLVVVTLSKNNNRILKSRKVIL